MKIKTTKQMNIKELFVHIFGSKNLVEKCLSDCGKYEVFAVHNGMITIADSGENQGLVDIPIDTTFPVEVEEELTEETVFDELAFVYGDYAQRPSSGSMVHKSIRNVLEHKFPIYKIYALVDRSLVLIWSRDAGIPADGVLEAD